MALLGSLRKGTYSAAVLAAIIAAPLTITLIGSIGVYIAIVCGLLGGTLIGYFTEYYTSDSYKPTQELSASSQSGAAPLIIGGISLAGGKGNVIGTMFGCIFLITLFNGFSMMGVDPFVQDVLKGVVLVVAITLDTLNSNRKKKS